MYKTQSYKYICNVIECSSNSNSYGKKVLEITVQNTEVYTITLISYT